MLLTVTLPCLSMSVALITAWRPTSSEVIAHAGSGSLKGQFPTYLVGTDASAGVSVYFECSLVQIVALVATVEFYQHSESAVLLITHTEPLC
jgi:hypothetical protein